uniref:Uncharacterized protein n=2 Tax=Photinus pyralis TaxID=7054 RepID=A0A1Y1LTX7_PHOPY
MRTRLSGLTNSAPIMKQVGYDPALEKASTNSITRKKVYVLLKERITPHNALNATLDIKIVFLPNLSDNIPEIGRPSIPPMLLIVPTSVNFHVFSLQWRLKSCKIEVLFISYTNSLQLSTLVLSNPEHKA